MPEFKNREEYEKWKASREKQGYSEKPAKKGWWSRNWKWFVPVSIGSVVLLIGFIGALFYFVIGIFKSSDVYKIALEQSRASPKVIESLGTPIRDGMFISGNIKISGSEGTADFEIPIHGPKGYGVIYVVAKKSMGRWYFRTLEVAIDSSYERIDLLKSNEQT